VAAIGAPVTRPRRVHGAMVTWWSRRIRFSLPEGSNVRMKATLPATAMCTGVPTAVPSRRLVVSSTWRARANRASWPAAMVEVVMSGLLVRVLPTRRCGAFICDTGRL